MIQIEEFLDRRDGKFERLGGGQSRYAFSFGGGQLIETEMANDLDLKIFRVRQGRWKHANGDYEPRDYEPWDGDRIANAIARWCSKPAAERDSTLEVIHLATVESWR